MENNQQYNEEDYAEEGNMDEYLDDDYLIQLHHELKKTKQQRKQAEQDTNLLDNRIKCLRNEEIKAIKRNEKMKRTTDKKINSIQQQEEALRKKCEFRERKARELELKREMNRQQKENNRMAILNKQEENRRKMEEDINNLREMKKANEEMKNYQKIEDLQNKKTQADYIKSQHVIAEEKRRAIELEKKNRIKQELERKILEEEERIRNAEMKKQMLEDQETEIMKSLKQTTQQHEALIQDYEKLTSSSKKKMY